MRGWTSLGGTHTSPVVVKSWKTNRVDIYTQMLDNKIWHAWVVGSGSWKTEIVPNSLARTTPAAVSTNSSSLFLMYVDPTDNSCTYIAWNQDDTHKFQKVGGRTLVSALSAVCFLTNRAVAYYLDQNGFLCGVRTEDNGSKWDPSGVCSEGGLPGYQSDPVAISANPNCVDIFILDENHALRQKSHVIDRWLKWESLGGCFLTKPTVVSRKNGTIDVFAVDTAHFVWHRSYHDNKWDAWENIGAGSTFEVAACCPSSEDIFVCIVDLIGNCLYRTWKGCTWSSTWFNLGGLFTKALSVISIEPDSVMIFGIGRDSGCWWSQVQLPIFNEKVERICKCEIV